MARRAALNIVVLLTCASSAFANATPAAKPEPKGFGKATFGMTVAAVKDVYPEMKTIEPKSIKGIKGMEAYELVDQKLDGFDDPVRVELRFLDGAIYFVAVELSSVDRRLAPTVLASQYGPPTHPSKFPSWILDTTTVAVTMTGIEIAAQVAGAEAGRRLFDAKSLDIPRPEHSH